MKAKKMYKEGGKLRGKTVTKEMVDKEFAHNFEVNANLTNEMAKQASTGLKKNGFPMKPANVKALKEQVKKRKEKEGKAKPNYRYVGTKLPAKDQPVFKKGGKINNPNKKVRPEVGKWYMKQSKEVKAMFDNAYESANKRGASPSQSRESAVRAVEKKLGKPIEFKYGGKMMKYLKGGQVKLDANKDGQITGADFMMLRKK